MADQKSIPRLRNQLKGLERMRKKAFDRWQDWMDGAWGQDPRHPLPIKDEARRQYQRYRELDAQVAVIREELMDLYRPIHKDLNAP